MKHLECQEFSVHMQRVLRDDRHSYYNSKAQTAVLIDPRQLQGLTGPRGNGNIIRMIHKVDIYLVG